MSNFIKKSCYNSHSFSEIQMSNENKHFQFYFMWSFLAFLEISMHWIANEKKNTHIFYGFELTLVLPDIVSDFIVPGFSFRC